MLTLFLASWLSLVVQPCLMAAPLNDHQESAVHHQSALSYGSAAYLPGHGTSNLSFSVDCESMEGCADWDGSYAVIPSLELEKKSLAPAVSATQIQSGPVSFSLPKINQKPLFSRVPLFIQNCAFLI